MAFNRKRGAQPGNRNALKHGFYAGALTHKVRDVLRRAQAIDPKELKHEIDILRTQMFQLVKNDPDNVTVLTMAMRTLVRLIALNHGLNADQENDLHHSMRTLILSLVPIAGED